MDLNQLLIFEKVCTTKSFTAAAASLGLKKSNVSMKIAALEERLGVKLLNRTTRKISITEAGLNYYQHCRDLLEGISNAEEEMQRLNQIPKGHLRIAMPLDLGLHCIHHFLKKFSSQYPQITVSFNLSHQDIDPNDQGIDLVIRPTLEGLRDSGLIVTKLFDTALNLYASPGFLKEARKRKLPTSQYSFIDFDPQGEGQIVHLKKRSSARQPLIRDLASLKQNTQFVFSDIYACKEACMAGLGATILPSWLVHSEVKDQKLILLDRDVLKSKATFYALLPGKKWKPKKTDLFLTALRKHFEDF